MESVSRNHVMNDPERIACNGILIEDVVSMPVYNETFVSPNYVICINHKGTADVEYDNNRVMFHPLDVALVYPNHTIFPLDTSPDYHATVIVVSTEVFASISNHVSFNNRFEYEQKADFRLTDSQYLDVMAVIEAMRAMSRIDSPTQPEIMKGMFLSLLEMLRVFRIKNVGNTMTQSIRSLSRRFHDAIIKHCCQHHDVAFYAGLFNLSPKYFSSQIRTETGHSASHWISIYVISQAKMIMRTQADATLQQVAYRLGFTEQSNFSRYFKRETGLSPAAWRKQTAIRISPLKEGWSAAVKHSTKKL